MGLNIPNLDEKNFDILLEEAMGKLPSLAPEWTEYNLSDPGITIIELLAWLSDINYYRLNRVGPKHEEMFLKIAGLKQEESKASNVLLTFTSWLHVAPYDKDEAVEEMDLEKRILVSKGVELFSNNMRFVTQKDLLVYPVNFEILEVKVKDFGEEKEVRKDDFYPFSKQLFNGSFFTVEFSHKIFDTLALYMVTSEYSDEVVQTSAVRWMCFDEINNDWIDIEVQDYTNNLTKSSEVLMNLPIKTNKVKCVLVDENFYETPPNIKKILLNSVLVVQETQHHTFVGESSGYVNQHFSLEAAPVSDSLEVKVGRDVWRQTDTLQDAKPNEKVYMLDGSELIFGDGAHGQIPRHKLDIHCRYLSNNGTKGNIAKGSSWVCEKIKSYKTHMQVQNYYEGWGGKDKITAQELLSGFEHSLHIPTRAISLKDYEYLALHTPYTHLVKAKAFANKETNHVNIIVVPKSEKMTPQANIHTRTKVLRFLDKKRLLTTKVSVIQAKYKSVSVDVEVFSQKHDPQELRIKIVAALNVYLHPLSGGKAAKGWKFGEDLYLWEVYKMISSIEGVESIEKLRVNNSSDTVIRIGADELLTAGKYNVQVKVPNPLVCRSRT